MFEYIITSEIFIDLFTAKVLFDLSLCSKYLYKNFENEYYKDSNNLNIYTWSRRYYMKIYIYGRAWDYSYINYLLPNNKRIIDNNITKINDSSITYENNKGETLFKCDECNCDDDIIFDFIYNLRIYKNILNCNIIEGKLTHEPHKINKPLKIINYYI